MNIFIKILISFSILFTLTGCQTNNSEIKKVVEIPDINVTDPTVPPTDPTVPPVDPTLPPVDPTDPPDTDPILPEPEIDIITVILPVSTKEVTLNSEVVNISVTVIDDKNNPYSGGEVKIVYPNDIRNGRDVGYFASSTVVPVNGVASFVYTAPSDLSADTSNLVFNFYHNANPTELKPYTFTFNPDNNQTVLTNYDLRTGNPNDVDMELDSSEIVSYSVYDESNNQVSDVNFTITSLNPSIGTLASSVVGPNDTDSYIEIIEEDSATINVNSNTKSGIVPLKVTASFIDVNGDTQSLIQVFNMIVLSGPPSAISLAYAGTEQAADRAKFIEKWVITVTDKYNNLVNNNPAVSTGMIAGYATSSATSNIAGNYLYYAPNNAAEVGSIDSATDEFTAQNDVFSDVDLDNDILVTFSMGYQYEALGKWDIETKAATVLGIEDYNGTNTGDLGFAVGHNQREDICDPGVKWIANVYPEDNNYIIGDTGTLAINVEYDYYLVGKSTILWANLVGIQHSTGEITRIGEGRKITLRGEGLEAGSYTYAKGFTGVIRFPITITNTVENYKNANFGYSPTVTGDGTSWNVSGTSMDDNVTSCNYGGVGYVDINISDSPENGGQISIVDVLPSREF